MLAFIFPCNQATVLCLLSLIFLLVSKNGVGSKRPKYTDTHTPLKFMQNKMMVSFNMLAQKFVWYSSNNFINIRVYFAFIDQIQQNNVIKQNKV